MGRYGECAGSAGTTLMLVVLSIDNMNSTEFRVASKKKMQSNHIISSSAPFFRIDRGQKQRYPSIFHLHMYQLFRFLQ